MKRPRVLLADDHMMVAEGLKNLISPEFDLVAIVGDGRAMVEQAKQLRPDVIVADITMPELNGLDAMAHLKKDCPNTKMVFLTMHDEPAYARRALEAGAAGYVLKHSAPAELIAAIHAALNEKTYVTPTLAAALMQTHPRDPQSAVEAAAALTPRQREILQLLAEGQSAKEVAAKLGISSRTVEFHKYHMMDILEVHNSAELIHFAIKNGIVAI
jgi:DNA-binding NarL/FixJ family response regulator